MSELDLRPLLALVHDPPALWPCKHRRAEEVLTEAYSRSRGGLLIREYQVKSQWTRWLDGLLLHEDAAGVAFPNGVLCGKCLGDVRRAALNPIVRGSRATVVQTKLETLGTVVLGQTLFGALVLDRWPWPPAERALVALCTAHEPELERLLPTIPGAEAITVEVGAAGANGAFRRGVEQPKKPTREIPSGGTLRSDALALGRPTYMLRLASGEAAEAVYETHDGFLVVHSARKPMSLSFAGLVLFFRAVLATREPDAHVRSIGISTQADRVVTELLRRYPGCDALDAAGRPW